MQTTITATHGDVRAEQKPRSLAIMVGARRSRSLARQAV